MRNFCFPEAVDVAVSIYCYRLVLAAVEHCFCSLARCQILDLSSVFGFQKNE